MRRNLSNAAIALLLLITGCTSSTDNLDATDANSSDAQSATLTTEAADFDDDGVPPREGSVADLENPIQILEDGLTFDPEWRADITLTCGPDPETRTIAVFDVNTNNRGTAALDRMEPSNGGFAHEPVTVGAVVATDVDLAWRIPGILLGPWRVDTIIDACGNEQANGLVPFTAINVEQRAGAPYSTDIATTQAEVDLLMAERDLDPVTLDPGTAVLSFVFAESSSPMCASGSLAGLRFSAEDQSLSPILGPSPAALMPAGTEIICNDDANPNGFILAVNLDDLPPTDFWLSLGTRRESGGAPFDYTTRVDTARASNTPFGDAQIVEATAGLEVGESGVALHVPILCGRESLFFDIDGTYWFLDGGDYDIPESWWAASGGNERINLILERTSAEQLLATPLSGADPATYYRAPEAIFAQCV